MDVMTYVFHKVSGIPANRIIGSGTVLDTARLQAELAKVGGEEMSIRALREAGAPCNAMICVLKRRIAAYGDRCFAVQDYAAAIENMLLAIVLLESLLLRQDRLRLGNPNRQKAHHHCAAYHPLAGRARLPEGLDRCGDVLGCGGHQGAEAHQRGLRLQSRLDNSLRRYVPAQVDDAVAIVLQEHLDDIFADVMDGPVRRAIA